MRATKTFKWFAVGAVALCTANVARGGVIISELMYNGLGVAGIGEFAEFTNTGPGPVDMTGWSFDDSSRLPGSESLTAFGTLAAGESAVITDDTAANFKTNWGLPASFKVIGGNVDNLGRSDEINLYDSTSTLVDQLTYNDQGTGSVKVPLRTQGVTANMPLGSATPPSEVASSMVGSVAGDAFGSHTSLLGEVGSPGGPVPEPASMGLLAGGALLLRRRRRQV